LKGCGGKSTFYRPTSNILANSYWREDFRREKAWGAVLWPEIFNVKTAKEAVRLGVFAGAWIVFVNSWEALYPSGNTPLRADLSVHWLEAAGWLIITLGILVASRIAAVLA
jgi:hypothetical protein